ncbi:MAG: hypothetical protein Q9170_000158 [Blastenia crenularia]
MTATVLPEPSPSLTRPIPHQNRKENASHVKVTVLTRSASSKHLPGLSSSSVVGEKVSIPRTLSDNATVGRLRHAPTARYDRSWDGHERETNSEDETKAVGRHVFGSMPDPKAAPLTPSSELLLGAEDEALEMHEARPARPVKTNAKPRSMSRSLSRLARKSWISSSRSISPSPSKYEHKQNGAVSSESSPPFVSSSSNANPEDASTPPTKILKGQRRPLSTFMGKVSSESAIPSVPSVPKSFSTDKLPFVQNRALGKTPTIPASASVERLQSFGMEISRKKDELWSAFRTLDGDFQKFQSRTSTLKTAVVRSTLLPFLRSYADHSSNTALRPEDLDRRIIILNRWWTGLLEMLNGRNGESVSGSDRPAILEAVTSIMGRTEWSMPYQGSHFRHDIGFRPLPNSRSTTSLRSTSSDFLAESVLHNVKNIYVQNLLSQMAYVVDKMSARNVPASVVTFCGKVTAYAFFYCDSIAEILIRLWAPSQENMRRVLAEHHQKRDADLKDSSDSVVSNFPSSLHGLAFRSVRETMRHLRSRPQLPIATAYISWHGPWVSRWAGRDTDLFFVFTKTYYNLLNIFLPADLPPEDRLYAPGYILLQAQMMTVLDSVIQKKNGPNGQLVLDPLYSPSLQYDALLGEADASASVLPLPPSASARSMAEHRFIILLRDCLSGSALAAGKVREMFAHSFERLLKAAAQRTSIFDHNACLTLCDCMEEALAILIRHSASSASEYSTLDWPFWLRVCRRMTESQNTMTEIRLYAFLYSLWTAITGESSRKRQVCLEWLLDEAYFDITSGQGGPRISTAPCSPAPSRRLLIIRNDSQPTPGGMFLTFDSILSPSSSTVATAYERHSSIATLMGTDEVREMKNPPSMGKRSWSVLKNMMPFAASALDPPKDPLQGGTKTRSGDAIMQGKAKGSLSSKPSDGPDRIAFRAHSFKFSLEWIGGEKTPFGRERQVYSPRLPFSLSNRLKQSELTDSEIAPLESKGASAVHNKYAGRALAEWDLLVNEFREFFQRRIAEGVPNDSLVETPTLGVETFRRPG